MNLKIGNKYTKSELVELTSETNLKTSREGIYYCKKSDDIFLFVDLEKKGKEKRFHFDDFFEGDYFHWDSQPKQHINTPRVKDIIGENHTTHLFARVNQKFKSKTLPFIYCGKLVYVEHEEGTANPVHIIFQNIDYDDYTENEDLLEIYQWKPSKAGGESKTKLNKSKTISEQRKRKYQKPNKTERKGLVNSRVGQGYYRNLVIEKWEGKCALTGFDNTKLLIASHILPWSKSDDKQKLDPDNGILLSPNADALFDKHLITFNSEDGKLVSNISDLELERLGLSSDMSIKVTEGMKKYLEQHNEEFIK